MATEVLRSSGKLRLKVNGWSMLPAIRPGDELLIESAHGRDIGEGDIVLCQRGRRIVVHRIVADKELASGRMVTTRGDAMLRADLPIPESQVLGKLVMVIRNQKQIKFAGRAGALQSIFLWSLRRSNLLFRVAAKYCCSSEASAAHIV